MKKLILAAAILGMTNFAFAQDKAASKDSKDSKTCTKSCSGDKKCCKKGGTCDKDGKKAAPTTTTTTSDKK